MNVFSGCLNKGVASAVSKVNNSVQVTGALSRGTDVVFRVDIQGAQTVRRVFPDAVSLFLVGSICHLALCVGRPVPLSPRSGTCTMKKAHMALMPACASHAASASTVSETASFIQWMCTM